MAITAQISDNAFAPYRGTDVQCQGYPPTPGAIFFAYDTNKIYFDDGQGTRHVMSGSGIKFIYGMYGEDLIADESHDSLLPYPRAGIDAAYADLGLTPETYSVEDIIINNDYTFYRIRDLDNTYAWVEKMLVSGSGGGSAAGAGITISYRKALPSIIAKGRNIDTEINIIDTKLGSEATLYVEFYTSETAQTPYRTESFTSVPVGKDTSYSFTILNTWLQTGTNVIKLWASINGRHSHKGDDGDDDSLKVWRTLKVVDIHLVPDSQYWNPVEAKFTNQLDSFEFRYRVNYDASMTREEFLALVQNGDPQITAILDADNVSTSVKDTFSDDSGALSLSQLFATAEHGNHTLDIVATLTVNGQQVTITDDLHYEIGWFTADPDNPKYANTIIWSPFKHNAEFENYTAIIIPYMVMNSSKAGSVTVTYYVNDEEVSSSEVTYNSSQYIEWEVPNYKVGINTFTIEADNTTWTATVNITVNTKYSLEPAPNAILDLRSSGRSNDESASRRATWTNQGTKTSQAVLYENGAPAKVEFTGFNWYNNGWLRDSDGNVALRISNGAKLFIPATLFSNGGNQTYEFEFAIHNATDYSRLVTTSTVYLTYNQLKTEMRWGGSGEEPIPYDLELYRPAVEGDEDSLAIEIETGDKVPKENLTTGDEIIQRQVTTSGRGVFLKYYGTGRGIVLGTQESFLALSDTLLVNARYTDETRVKVSFVVSQNPEFTLTTGQKVNLGSPMIFAYINGVITNILPFPAGQQFDLGYAIGERSGIEIDSTYCDIDLYGIRIYDTDLPFGTITKNWTADGPTRSEKQRRYDKNQGILDANERYVDYTKTKAAGLIPIMVIQTPKSDGSIVKKTQDALSWYKGQKIGVNIRYYDPSDPEKCWHASNCQLNVQGTSSQGYPRRNFKFSLKAGSTDWLDSNLTRQAGLDVNPFRIAWWDGDEANKDIYDTDVANPYIKFKPDKDDATKNKGTLDIGLGMKGKSFCLKADYMDSSSSHNTPGANMVRLLAGQYGQYDLRHPLKRLINTNEPYTTTVYGYPIIMFWENGDGVLDYIGRYNLNYDKSSENVFGFTDETEHPYISQITTTEVDSEDAYRANEITIDNPTYADVTECWELTNNQAGHSKFQDDGVEDNWLDITTLSNGQQYYDMQEHFEQRYPEMTGTRYDGKEEKGNETEWRLRTKNLRKLWNWIRQTDVTSYIGRKGSQPVRTIEEIYYYTLSKTYEPGITYYNKVNDEYVEATITVTRNFTPTGAYKVKNLTLDDNGNITDQNYSTNNNIVFNTTVENVDSAARFIAWLKSKETDGRTHQDSEYFGEHNFTYEDNTWYYGPYEVDLLEDCGINFSDNNNLGIIYLTLTLNDTVNGFSTALYERFTKDNDRYRLAKFKNELPKHLNLAYCLFYFIYTEFFLLYDSRQKNMMIASWGPEEVGGEYIWYPIFYDLDTQLGVNNSGQVYWDYDTDATPPLTARTIFDQDGTANVEIYSSSGTTDSIFSGNGSVLWNNIQLCFANEYKALYAALRSTFNQTFTTTVFETNSSNKWSESMKNFDAYYKYIAPAVTGYVTAAKNYTEDTTSDYYYCLQGDRSLQRMTMIRNRFNYLDSEWGAGSYSAGEASIQIQMRYNFNDADRTSDTGAVSELKSTTYFRIKPYLSQYMTLFFDKTPSNTIKFNLEGAQDYIDISTPDSITKRANMGIALTQQLAYIRGPEYISDMGDLSLKYLNMLMLQGASRLRELKVGNEHPGYRNTSFTSLTIGAKGLLRSIDLTNLTALITDPDISNCPKLEEVKLLNTNIPSVTLPYGNVLTKAYLPELDSITLVTPLKLTTVLTDKATQASYQHNANGLYIENLTNNLSMIESGNSIPTTVTTKVSSIRMDDTQLGYGTYKILKYLYEVKRMAQAGTITNTAPQLAIQMLNVDWSPYRQVSSDESYDVSKINNYYIREYLRYKKYTYTDVNTWVKDTRNGVIYEYDEVKGASPIKDIDMLDHFITTYDNTSITYNQFYFRSIQTLISGGVQQKVIPTITGRLHIANDEEHPINEAQIATRYQSEKHFPKLDITADYVTESNRARFIEYLPDGTIHEFGTQKYDPDINGSDGTVVYSFDTPSRLHYDFLGWFNAEDNSIDWEASGSVNDEWMDTTGSITSATARVNRTINNQNVLGYLSSYDLATLPEGTNLTFVAVYALHGYPITYMMDNYDQGVDNDGMPFTIAGLSELERKARQLTSIAIAGRPVTLTDVSPWKDDSALDVFETYRFKGWRLDLSADATVYNGTSTLTVDRATTVYATFERESVYANPLGVNDLEIQEDLDATDGVKVTIKLSRKLRGKICIPKTVNWSPSDSVAKKDWKVTGLLAGAIENQNDTRVGVDQSTDGGYLSYQPNITHIFFKGCEVTPNTAYLTSFPDYAFWGDTNLKYVDIPDSLLIIGQSAFNQLGALMKDYVYNFKNVYRIKGAAFYRAWRYDDTSSSLDFTIYLSHEIFDGHGQGLNGSLEGNAFNTDYGLINRVIIGSSTAPVTSPKGSAIKGDALKDIQSIIVYITNSVDQEALRNYIVNGGVDVDNIELITVG